MDPKNIEIEKNKKALVEFLENFRAYFDNDRKNFLICVQIVDGIMTIFSDENLDEVYFENQGQFHNGMMMVEQMSLAFYKKNKTKI